MGMSHLTIENCQNAVTNDWNDTVLFDTVDFLNNTNSGLEIYPSGKDTIIRYSTFSGNSTAYEGGAIDHGGGDLKIEASTFSGNFNVLPVGRGGAIRVHGAGAVIVNSTFSGNRSVNEGGAIQAEIYSTVDIRNCTFNDNDAHFLSSDLGAYYDATITVSNSIFTGGCEGQVISAGNNFDKNGACGLDGPGDQVGADPNLSPLTNNGGPTMTHMPNSGSPVIDAGNSMLVTEDYEQRGPGYPRIINEIVDIGAVEWGIIFRDSFEQIR
jgi:predicted outer membrane repeat protein